VNELEPFRQHVLNRVKLSEEKLETFVNAFSLRTVRKKQFIAQPDFVTGYRTYVLDGALRSYVISPDVRKIQFSLR
jgi:hypothetical protein